MSGCRSPATTRSTARGRCVAWCRRRSGTAWPRRSWPVRCTTATRSSWIATATSSRSSGRASRAEPLRCRRTPVARRAPVALSADSGCPTGARPARSRSWICSCSVAPGSSVARWSMRRRPRVERHPGAPPRHVPGPPRCPFKPCSPSTAPTRPLCPPYWPGGTFWTPWSTPGPARRRSCSPRRLLVGKAEVRLRLDHQRLPAGPPAGWRRVLADRRRRPGGRRHRLRRRQARGELAALAAYPDAVLARAGMILGPTRTSAGCPGGSAASPAAARSSHPVDDRPWQYVDVRDLAAWITPASPTT